MHTNPETLALLALGEPAGTPQERAHVADCPLCTHEVDDLAHLAGVGRSTDQTYTLSTPGPEVWERIVAELGFAPVADGGQPAEDAVRPDAGPAANRAEVVDLASRSRPPAPAAPRSDRRLLTRAVAAGVALLLVGVGIGLGIDRLRGEDETVVATAPLAALPAHAGASGDAEVIVDGEGRSYLVVNVSTPQPLTVERQVWVLSEAKPGEMKNLGVFTENGQRFSVNGIDLSQFPLVDVSAEPDANPAHSGDSIVRGKLSL